MINIRSIRKLANNDGLTLKAGKPIRYKSGWQVATHGIKCTTAEEAIKAVKMFKGNCGIWFENKMTVLSEHLPCHRIKLR